MAYKVGGNLLIANKAPLSHSSCLTDGQLEANIGSLVSSPTVGPITKALIIHHSLIGAHGIRALARHQSRYLRFPALQSYLAKLLC